MNTSPTKNTEIKKPVIVVVDDELIILNSIKSLLRRQYLVHTFSDPFAAESFLNNNSVDLLISDEMMPGLKGSELVARIQRRQPDICKIILSGHAEKESIAAAVNNGHIFAFLFKPVDKDILFQVISNGLEHKKMKEKIKIQNNHLENYNRELEKKVNERTRQLLEMEKFYEVGKFSASIVHNLNGPLQALITAMQMLEYEFTNERPASKREVRYFEILDENLIIMEKMIKSITSGVRSQQHEADIELCLNELLLKTNEYMKIDHYFKNSIELELSLDKELPKIFGQETHFLQIFTNLLKNAADAMKYSEEKTLKITTDNLDTRTIKINISDTGCGIARENIPKIFSSNFTTKPPGQGTGLGLAITKQMIESYKGNIDVHSIEGGGTTFSISIPTS